MPSLKSAWSICRAARSSSARLFGSLAIVTALCLPACATPSTPRLADVQCPEPPTSVLIPVACPPMLDGMADDSMGAMAEALMSAAETYHACRAACVGSQ